MYKLILIAVLTIISFNTDYSAPKKIKNIDNYGENAVILCFHDINGEGKYSITEQEFDEILGVLKDDYEVYSLEKWYYKVKRKEKFKKKPVVLTFDDGYESIFKLVIPKLKNYSFGATFFIYLERYKDNSSAYSFISGLPDSFEIGSHSFTHADMQNLFNNDSGLFFKEIFLSRKKLSFLTKKNIISWAWPYGYYNSEMVKMARYAGYEIQVNTDYKTTKRQWKKSSFSRFTIQNPDPVNQLKEILNKNYPQKTQ